MSVAAAARSGRFGEYNYRCACIAQLVEQLTLNQRNFADSSERPRTNLQLTQISCQSPYRYIRACPLIATVLDATTLAGWFSVLKPFCPAASGLTFSSVDFGLRPDEAEMVPPASGQMPRRHTHGADRVGRSASRG